MPEHPHVFDMGYLFCRGCGVTQAMLAHVPRDSILWRECRPGVVADYLRQTGQLKKYKTVRIN